ncbi:MAG TPA: dTMP kinase [Longimicrobiales bacterium]|nr:dTMP kinase [Longimicrobiales bacterium]
MNAAVSKPLFVVLEGVEGSGKSTQVRLLGEWLAARGIPHVLTREPGGTQVGEEIRRALLHGGEVPARTELLLMLAARSAFVEQVVRPALGRGDVVVADRYELSSFAYQGHGRGLGLDAVRAANAFATGGLRPDLTVVIDVPAAEGAARVRGRGASADRIEQAGTDFHDAVARAYRLLSESEPDVAVVDGTAPAEAVHAAIVDLLGSRFPETFGPAQG